MANNSDGTATATNPSASAQTAVVPFPIASRIGLRPSFTDTKVLSATAPTQATPIQIPAVGFVKRLWLEVILTGTGGTTPAWAADGPFNALASIGFRTAAGNDVIVPTTGYNIALNNKYNGPDIVSDPRAGAQYKATAPSAHFFLTLDFEFDPETGLGSIPALASNRSYQLNVLWAAISQFVTGAPTITATINAQAEYWFEPPATSSSGLSQATATQGLGTLSQLQIDNSPLTAGDKLIKLNNVGSVLRNIIFILRNSSGARIETNGWPDIAEILLDNNTLFNLPKTLWEEKMRRWFNLNQANKDVAGGLDTGVYVIPFHAMTGGISGDPANSRAQLLPTLDSSQLQIRGVWGSQASTLEIITNNIVPAPGSSLFNK